MRGNIVREIAEGSLDLSPADVPLEEAGKRRSSRFLNGAYAAASRCRGLEDRRSRQRRAQRDPGGTSAPHNTPLEAADDPPSRIAGNREDFRKAASGALARTDRISNCRFRPP